MSGNWGARNVFATFWNNASYKSFGKPHFRESDSEEAAGLPLSNCPSNTSNERPALSVLQPDKRVPSSKLTTHQLLYIAGSHGLGAMAISGGINFAIAYGESMIFNPCHPTPMKKIKGWNCAKEPKDAELPDNEEEEKERQEKKREGQGKKRIRITRKTRARGRDIGSVLQTKER